ncbi:DNA polymerase (pol2) [Spizellomyces punctatus DAOM BR117]|uniref:DNA polymerase n=1 Tax=Spizellomyces punctatus (strain DAOM BR117) TaxID=645134 RepID=A0A0L0HLZ6_SPIPD|nr:DNA polymerase (pol2) [Spizellomyces punctatus DAOM BR117]KND02063.1 DNA polymerase (pol2) [Spizellomyces punctatus DAOM BR117]|eukprot:XP_016610102.1 DNA polymerase (pol2) [Spizellomyces punctatus DAOM BR117]
MSRQSALQKLRERRAGGSSRLEEYEVEEDAHIYDEITEDEYTAMRRQRMLEGDNFVIDDDGLGYVDYGQDEWASGNSDDSGSDVEVYDKDDAKGKRKRGKGKDKEKDKQGGDIKNLFNKQSKNPKPKPKPVVANTVSAEKEEDLLGSIFNDLDNEVDLHAPKRPKVEHTAPVLTSTSSSTIRKEAANPFIVDQEDRARESLGNGKNTIINEIAVKVEPIHQDPYDFQTQEAFDMGAPMDDDDDVVLVEEVFPINSLVEPHSCPAIKVEEPEDSDVVEVQVKPLQTKTGKRTAAASFVPKFERVDAKAEPTVVSAPTRSNCQGWMSMKDSIAVQGVESSQPGPGPTAVRPADVLEEDGSLRMYWLDAFEKDGVVYLFGKVLKKKEGSYVSCCVIVNNMQRNVLVLPREKMLDDDGHQTDIEVEMPDVYSEFDALRKKYKISEFASAKVSRNYAFEIPGVPAESDYLKVVYPFSQPALPAGLSGKSFSRMFGTNTSALELFILKRRLMGPCWVEIKDANLTNKNISWCKIEVTVDNPKTLNPFREDDSSAPKQAPPLVVMSLSLRTVMNHKKHINEIVVASGLVYHNVNLDGVTTDQQQPTRFTVVRQLEDIPLPAGFNTLLQQQKTKVEILRNERGLLGFLIAQIHRSDPDIIVGHNFIDFDLDVLLHRMKWHKVDQWSKIGRLRRTKWPHLQKGAGGTADSTFAERQIASGRLLCDTYRAAQDLIRSKSYSLTQLAASQLKVDRPNIDYEKIPTYFWDAGKLLEMIQHCEFDGYLQAQLMFKLQVLPLTRQLTNLAGNLWARTMTGARAERNEYLLLHEFHNKKFVVPDKIFGGKKVITDQLHEMEDEGQPQPKQGSSRRKPAYAGGLVLEPKKGFYDKFVLLLDFNSLYPSIIQEYNICFTTVDRSSDGEEGQMPDVPDPDLAKGILPKLLAALVERRRAVKNLMKDPKATPAQLAQYDIRQKALKLTANSMYGCLGFSHSRFYAKPLAMLITSKGREILQNTVDLAEQEHLEVIYGDTDSIMIHTNTHDLAQVKKIGNEFKKAVNKRYNLLEIEMDGYYQRMLLLKKKKYAALSVEEKDGRLQTVLETKGLDLVRRDWCGLSQDVSSYILNQIFSEDDKENVLDKIHAYLSKPN